MKTQYDLQTYRETTDEVIRESAKLNDERKLKSEFFEDKARSILGSIFFTIKWRQFGIGKVSNAIWCHFSAFKTFSIVELFLTVKLENSNYF